jgi:uncharacterized protein (TIGR02246 family)
MIDDASQVASAVLARLDAAWNAADGAAFAAEFTEAVDVVNIFGMHIRGRAATAERMQHIFDTIFQGSRHRRRQLEEARFLAADVVLAISSATVEIPTGPLAPEMNNRQTAILVREGGAWRITAWQNTLIGGPPGSRRS